jgi:cation diffusion facilitator family transporter
MAFTRKSKAAFFSICSNSTLILIKLIAGIITGSVSLIAEAIHSLMDLVAAIVAFFSVRIADRPADKEHPYGHGKVENVSGVIEGILIFIAAGIIIYEAIHKLINGVSLELLEVGIGIMGLSIVVNVIISRYLFKIARETDSLALEADARHLTTDILTMGGVFLGLIIVRITGLNFLDPIIAILVAGLIIRAAYEIVRKSFGGLIDVKLPEEEEKAIAACIEDHPSQVVGYHKLRTRKAGSERFIELHLIMRRNTHINEAHSFSHHLQEDIKKTLRNANVTIHIEPCEQECDVCKVTCSLRNKTRSLAR